jgi:hypothetical protein
VWEEDDDDADGDVSVDDGDVAVGGDGGDAGSWDSEDDDEEDDDEEDEDEEDGPVTSRLSLSQFCRKDEMAWKGWRSFLKMVACSLWNSVRTSASPLHRSLFLEKCSEISVWIAVNAWVGYLRRVVGCTSSLLVLSLFMAPARM